MGRKGNLRENSVGMKGLNMTALWHLYEPFGDGEWPDFEGGIMVTFNRIDTCSQHTNWKH